MAGVVTTSLIVQFGNDDDGQYILSAEIDSRPEGYNKGKTQFLPGDSPVYLIYKSAALSLTIDQSTGASAANGSGTTQEIEYLIFANEDTKRLSKPHTGNVTLKYLAGVVGAKVKGDDVVLPESGIAVYKVTYNAPFLAYKMKGIPLTLQGEDTFPVVVVIVGTAA